VRHRALDEHAADSRFVLLRLLADFRGYKPGYSDVVRQHPNYLTWVVLKGHTNNTAAEVTLASRDPRARPVITFNYFEEGSDASGDDLTAVVKVCRLSADDRRFT
jgi:hypothetical protein